jgi:hypothetical protein
MMQPDIRGRVVVEKDVFCNLLKILKTYIIFHVCILTTKTLEDSAVFDRQRLGFRMDLTRIQILTLGYPFGTGVAKSLANACTVFQVGGGN